MSTKNLAERSGSGSTLEQIKLVADREISVKLRDKAFIGSTIVMLILVAASIAVPAFLGRDSKTKIAVTTPAATQLVQAAAKPNSAGNPDLIAVQAGNLAAAEELVRKGEAKLLLEPSANGYVAKAKGTVDNSAWQRLSTTLAQTQTAKNAATQGVDLAALSKGAEITKASMESSALSNEAGRLVGLVMAMAFYVTCLMFGMTIAQSVVVEKESRVVEILAAAIPTRAMLWGKIIGNAAMAFAQVVLLAIVAVAGLAITGQTDLLAPIGLSAIWYIAFFVVGFLALASLWAVAGSMASRQEDIQSTSSPFSMLLMLGFLASLAGSAMIKTVMSYVPILSSFGMPMRVVTGETAWWEPAVSLVVAIIGTVLLVRLGAGAYERTLLRTGRKLSFKEAFASR